MGEFTDEEDSRFNTISFIVISDILYAGKLSFLLDIPPKNNINSNYKHNNTIIVNIILLIFCYKFLHLFNILVQYINKYIKIYIKINL